MGDKNRKTLLLVEDDMIIAMAQKKALERYGYDAIAVYSGEEAVALFKKSGAIDLILMDIDLGKGMSGPDAATEILKDHDVPVVFLSSHTEPEIVEQTEKITSYGYVVKDSGITVLDASIKMAFKLFDANRRLSRSNEDMRHHSQLLENIIENFPGFVLWKDPQSRFLGCNTNFAKKCGFSSPAEIIGKSDYDLPFYKEEVEGFLEDDRMVMETGTPKLHFEEREHVAQGEEIYLDTCKIPLFDADGSVSGILAVAMEITRHKRAEAEKDAALAALRESEFKYRSLIEHSTDVVFCVNEKGEYQFANQVFASTFGKTPDYFIGKNFWDIYPKEHADHRQAASIRVFETGETQSVEVEVPLPDRTLHYLAKANPVRDETGRVVLNLTTATDITDRKLMEDALKKSEMQYRVLFEQAAVGVAKIETSTGRFVTINKRYCDIVGYRMDEMLDLAFQKITFPDDLQDDLDNMELLRRNELREFTMEKRYIHKNGSIVWVNLTVSPLWQPGETPDYHVAIVEDITKRKLAEKKIHDLLAEKELLLKEVHHRIKNNMSTVRGLLSLQISAEKDPSVAASLKDTLGRVQSMITLYDRLFGSQHYREMPVKDYLESLAGEIIDNFPNRDMVELAMEVDDFILHVNILSPLGIIINELLTNIMKHAFNGRDSGKISISAAHGDGGVTIAVQDNGVGIPESVDLEQSTGFGLTLVRMLAGQIGGTIRLERGRGTRFLLQFKG